MIVTKDDNHSILRIGNAQAFWGDRPSAPITLFKQQPDLQYITLDYLSEVSLSIMAIQREKDSTKGYAEDFLDVVQSFAPFWQKGAKVKIVANAGGLNPAACAQACKNLLSKAGCPNIKIGIVSGDDVVEILKSHPQEKLYHNLDTQKPLSTVLNKLVTANAYLGAEPIVEALERGADIVITGRVADPSLTVGPAIFHFKWNLDEFQKISSATIAGHLLECGTQVTGGISTNWLSIQDAAHIGFPFVEMQSDGTFVITKPAQTSGIVSIQTVKEQLLYEIGDPDNYLSPDVTASFLSLEIKEIGKNRVEVKGAKGKPPTPNYKVSATFRDGFKTETFLAIFGSDAEKKAKRTAEIILEHSKESGYSLERTCVECFGNDQKMILRIAVADQRKEALECFAKEVASLVTSGPQGLTGYTSGRPHIRPIFSFWPCLIEKKEVKPKVEIL